MEESANAQIMEFSYLEYAILGKINKKIATILESLKMENVNAQEIKFIQKKEFVSSQSIQIKMIKNAIHPKF